MRGSDSTQSDFRFVLRQSSHRDHARVDELLSTFDVSTQDGFLCFLHVHATCFEAMMDVAEAGSAGSLSLRKMLELVTADIIALGSSRQGADRARLPQVDPLALDYMVEGSRLGSKVLQRRWSQSQDPKVQGADAYFSLEPVPGRWRDVCSALSDIPVGSRRASTITEDTERLFGLFHRIATDWTPARAQEKERIS